MSKLQRGVLLTAVALWGAGAWTLAEAKPRHQRGRQSVSQDDKKNVVAVGKLTGEGVECQAFRAEDGTLYTLVGDLKGFKAGDKVRVVGEKVEFSTCMQGTTLSVKNIKRAK
jgi:hypothetical protein